MVASERGNLPQPTRTELNILGILWDKGRGTVREVHEALNEVEVSGYTTALKNAPGDASERSRTPG